MKKINSSLSIFLLLFFITSNLVFPQLTRKAPYLIYNGNETEMQVLWQLYSTDTCRIDWGTDTLYSLGSAQTYEYGTDHQYTYTITNLTPATKYYYRVTAGQEVHTGNFRSAPDTNSDAVNFFVYGDTRSNPGTHDQVAAAMLETYYNNSEFQTIVISSGDLVSNGDNESAWTSEFFDPSYSNIQEMLATMPYNACMGNHEESGVLFKKYFPYPFVNGRYWSFDYGPAHFVVVDQYTNYGSGSDQLNWIENDLASTTKSWKFIYLHEPGWTAGHHSNNTDVQNYIQPLCEEYGVPIVLGGHNHYYARAEVNNIQHITTGGGGAPLYQPDTSYPNIVTATMAYHFCAVEINKDTLKLRAITPDGEIIDSFSVVHTSVGVEFTVFSAKYNNNNSVLLSWQTSTETNNRGFEIQRSINKRNWVIISFKEGNGTTTKEHNYTYSDNVSSLISDKLFYRLKQVDFNGNNKYSGIVEVSVSIPKEFSLSQNYPNPFNPTTTISWQSPVSGWHTLKVYDSLGKVVATLVNEYKPAGKYEVVFDGSNLPSGTYIYKLTAVPKGMQAGIFTAVKKLILLK